MWIKNCSMCQHDADSYYNIYGTIYCKDCFPKSTYYKQWKKDLRDEARPAQMLLIISIIGLILMVFTVIASLVR